MKNETLDEMYDHEFTPCEQVLFDKGLDALLSGRRDEAKRLFKWLKARVMQRSINNVTTNNNTELLKLFFTIIALILLTVMATGCDKKQVVKDCSVQVAGKSRLVAFGDSQTMGVKSNIDGCQYSYAYEIATRLNLNMVNRAIGGSNLFIKSKIGPAQKDMILNTVFESTDTVIYQAGFNDITYNGDDPVALDLFKTTLASLLLNMSSQVDHIYLATPIRMPSYSGTKGSFAIYDMYVQAVKDAAIGIPNITVLETNTLMTFNVTDFMDGIHIDPVTQRDLAITYLSEIQ